MQDIDCISTHFLLKYEIPYCVHNVTYGDFGEKTSNNYLTNWRKIISEMLKNYVEKYNF